MGLEGSCGRYALDGWSDEFMIDLQVRRFGQIMHGTSVVYMLIFLG